MPTLFSGRSYNLGKGNVYDQVFRNPGKYGGIGFASGVPEGKAWEPYIKEQGDWGASYGRRLIDRPGYGSKAKAATPTSSGDLNKEYQGYYNTLGDTKAGQVEGGAAQGLFYNPTGAKGGFQSLTSSALSDPTVYGNVTKMFKDPTADKAWGDVLGKYNPAALKTPGGSTHGIADAVLKKMWT